MTAGAGRFRGRVLANTADVGESTVLQLRTDGFVEIIANTPPIKQNDRAAEAIARFADMFTTMDGERNGRGGNGLWTLHRCVPVRTTDGAR